MVLNGTTWVNILMKSALIGIRSVILVDIQVKESTLCSSMKCPLLVVKILASKMGCWIIAESLPIIVYRVSLPLLWIQLRGGNHLLVAHQARRRKQPQDIPSKGETDSSVQDLPQKCSCKDQWLALKYLSV
uniref:Uncharacterized protein n=1 Tax=Opuntia streptacantha TaxID=393608 RepID=A0A7C9CW71_OPUST